MSECGREREGAACHDVRRRQPTRGIEVALRVCCPAEPEASEDQSYVRLGGTFPEGECLLQYRGRAIHFSIEEPCGPVLRQRGPDAVHVAALAEKGERRLEVRARGRVSALRQRDERAGEERASTQERVGIECRERERSTRHVARLAELTECIPEPVDGSDETQRHICARRIGDRPVRSGANVVVFSRESLDYTVFGGTAQELRLHRFHQRQVIPGEARLDLVALAAHRQSLHTVLAHCLEQESLTRAQESEAPFHGSAERAVPGQRRTTAGAEEAECVIQPTGDLLR